MYLNMPEYACICLNLPEYLFLHFRIVLLCLFECVVTWHLTRRYISLMEHEAVFEETKFDFFHRSWKYLENFKFAIAFWRP